MKVPHENLNALIAMNAEMTSILNALVIAILRDRAPESKAQILQDALRILDLPSFFAMPVHRGAQVKMDSVEMKALQEHMKAALRAYFEAVVE